MKNLIVRIQPLLLYILSYVGFIFTESIFAQSNIGADQHLITQKWKPYHKYPDNFTQELFTNSDSANKYKSVSNANNTSLLSANNFNKEKTSPYTWRKMSGPFGGDAKRFYEFNNELYAITERDIYKYKNNEWISLNFGNVPFNMIMCLYVSNTGRILAGCDWGLYYYNDTVETWQLVSAELSYTGSNDFLVDGNGNLLISTTNGLYISKQTEFVFSLLSMEHIPVLTISFDNSGNIWAGTDKYIYKSKYPELNWQKINLDIDYCRKILFDSNGVIYALSNTGIYRSLDSGKTWFYMEGYFGDITLLNDDLIFTGLHNIYSADNQGIKWQSTKTDCFLRSIYIQNENEFLISSLGSGAMKYDVNENEFYDFSNGMSASTIRSILVLKNDQILLSTDANYFYLSSDNGTSWVSTLKGRSFLMKNGKNNSIYAAIGSEIVKSNDFGKTWNKLNIDVAPFLLTAFDIGDDSITICAGTSSGELYVSYDSGINFQQRKNKNFSWISGIKIVDNKTFLICGDSLFITKNGGLTFFPIKLEKQANVYDIIIDNDGYIFAATYYGIYRSPDGTNWTLFELTNSSDRAPAFRLGVDAYNNLYAVSGDGIVQVSHDKGKTWDALINAIQNTFLWSFSLSPKGYFYAGTQQAGLYSVGIDYLKNNVLTKFYLSNNFPNPFNSSTRIDYKIPADSYVTLKVYDILGRETETLVSGQKNAGSYYTFWYASNYSSGVYIYKLQYDNHIEIKKMILLR